MLNAGGAQRARASHWVTSGLPFLAFIVAGSVGVSVLLQVCPSRAPLHSRGYPEN